MRFVESRPLVCRKRWPKRSSNTGDAELDKLLETAREKFLNHSLDVRKEAPEKLWDAWERLSRVLRAEGRPEEADAALRTAGGIVPEFFDTLLILGRIRAAEGQWREAADCFRRALAMEPDDPVARAGLAQALGQVEGGTGAGPPVDHGRPGRAP